MAANRALATNQRAASAWKSRRLQASRTALIASKQFKEKSESQSATDLCTFGYGSKLRTWGTTDLSLFSVLTCINHPITGVLNFDSYPFEFHTTVMLQSQQRHPWGHRKTRHRCESHRGHRFSLGSRPCPAAKHLGFHWLRTGLL